MEKKMISKVGLSVVLSAAAMLASVSASAGNLTPIDSIVTTTFDKSVIHGSLAHYCDASMTTSGTVADGCTGPLAYDKAGSARFVYSGQIYAVSTNSKTGELVSLTNQIGSISGEAAFPKDFVGMSTQVNDLMDAMMNGYTGPMPQFPSVIHWTCNHCDLTVNGTRYLSIVDVLDPDSANYNSDMAAALDNNLADGAAGALQSMGMDGRAFTGVGPTTFDPATKTMGVRMAGCSALVAVSGPEAGKIGTLCMNSTAVFNVGQTKDMAGSAPMSGAYDEHSDISADGSSNCVTVMQPMR